MHDCFVQVTPWLANVFESLRTTKKIPGKVRAMDMRHILLLLPFLLPDLLKEEVEEYKQRDPIEQVLGTIRDHSILSEAELEAINKKVKMQVEEAVKFAEESPWPDGMDAFKDVYVQEDYPFVME